MASASAPYLVTSSVSSISLSHPSPAPSSSPLPASPASSTSSEIPRKRKRDEFLATPEPVNVSSPVNSFVERNVSAPTNMYAVRFFSSIWETLKDIVGIDTSTIEPTRAVDEAPESPQKRVCVDSSPKEEVSTSDDQPNKEPIPPTTQSAPTQVLNKEPPSQAINNRGTLKIKAPASMARQAPPTQQLPSPLASSSEDEGESVFKKTSTTKPVRPTPAKMCQKISVLGGPLEQNELPFFAEPLHKKRGGRSMLQRALARREAHTHRALNYSPVASRFPLHLQRREVYKSAARTPLAVSQESSFTPGKMRLPQDIWAAMRIPGSSQKTDLLSSSTQSRAARLMAHKGRVQKKVRESYAKSQQKARAENESLEVLLRQLIADKIQGFHSYEEVARRRQERAKDVQKLREAETRKETIPPLTPEQAKLVKEITVEVCRDFRSGRNKTYIQKFKIPIGTRDLYRVPSGNWLNDEVINFYLNMVVDRSKTEHPGEPQKILAHNTYFFTKLTEKDYRAVSRWATRQGVGGKDLLKLDFLFVPVHINGNHWCLAVANFKMRRFEYYDSLGRDFQPKDRPEIFRRMREYVEAETGTTFAHWTDYVMAGAPQQSNGSDCGAFTVKTAEVLARGGKLSFGADDMPLVRNRILLEVLRGSLLPPVAED